MPRRFALVGNPGAGKSWLGNKMLGREQFRSEIGVNGVTTELGFGSFVDPVNGEQIELIDTPGLHEAEFGDRNKAILQSALSRGGEYRLVFVFGCIGGRLRSEDIHVYKELCKGYKLSNLPIILNNLDVKPTTNGKDDGNITVAEKLSNYLTKLRQHLQGHGIVSDDPTACAVVPHDADEETAKQTVLRVAERFAWQPLPEVPPNAMEFDMERHAAAEEQRAAEHREAQLKAEIEAANRRAAEAVEVLRKQQEAEAARHAKELEEKQAQLRAAAAAAAQAQQRAVAAAAAAAAAQAQQRAVMEALRFHSGIGVMGFSLW